jgi:hypothetical protein
MRTLIVICFLGGFLQAGYAQYGNKQDVLTELQKLAGVYKNALRLSFDVTYRYSAADKPGDWLDSLSGHCKLSGNKYWYDINDIESVCTDKYVILLFKEDRLMYLARSGAASATGAAMASPASQLESFLKNDTAILCSVKEEKAHRKITIDFTTPGMYKRIDYYVNRQTGFLEKMVSLVSSDQLYDEAVRSLVDEDGTYALVEAVYSNYRQGSFDDTLFSSELYFKKEGDEYITVAPYDMYKIFQGTPNL